MTAFPSFPIFRMTDGIPDSKADPAACYRKFHTSRHSGKASKSGTIVLTGWMEDGDIVLLISDDGVGIAPDKLPMILSGEGTSISGGTNIAIYNTHRRLQVLYGADYGLTYSSDVGKGTEVQIRIPAKKDAENK